MYYKAQAGKMFSNWYGWDVWLSACGKITVHFKPRQRGTFCFLL